MCAACPGAPPTVSIWIARGRWKQLDARGLDRPSVAGRGASRHERRPGRCRRVCERRGGVLDRCGTPRGSPGGRAHVGEGGASCRRGGGGGGCGTTRARRRAARQCGRSKSRARASSTVAPQPHRVPPRRRDRGGACAAGSQRRRRIDRRKQESPTMALGGGAGSLRRHRWCRCRVSRLAERRE